MTMYMTLILRLKRIIVVITRIVPTLVSDITIDISRRMEGR